MEGFVEYSIQGGGTVLVEELTGENVFVGDGIHEVGHDGFE